jgi:hypothetical protein
LKSVCKSPESESVSEKEISVPGAAECGDDTCLSEGDSKRLDNANSSPRAGHSPERINERLSGETHIEHSSSTSTIINANSESGGLETSAVPHLDSELKGTSHKNESKNTELISSQTVISENCYSSDTESHIKKCSGDCAESALCSCLKSEEVCDINGDMKVDPLILRIKSDSAVKESEWTVKKVTSYRSKSADDSKDHVVRKPKIRRPLYNAYWLQPNPDDFRLVADSVEGVRQLLMKYCDDDLVLIEQLNKKVRDSYVMINSLLYSHFPLHVA